MQMIFINYMYIQVKILASFYSGCRLYCGMNNGKIEGLMYGWLSIGDSPLDDQDHSLEFHEVVPID